jgi:outer membrane protein assembly factor BamB
MIETKRWLLAKCTFAFCIACTFPASSTGATSAEQKAKQILDATNIKGGLIVHVGCGDGRLTAALRANDRFIVHGLDTDRNNVRVARDYVGSLGLYGRISIDTFDGRHLPYIDNLVNLVVAEDRGDVPMAEVMRVLAPRGAAYIRRGGEWKKVVKPRPEEIDEWTHYLHNASNNAVAHDHAVSMPYHIQWVDAPKWARHHNHLSTTSAMVTSGGRLFAIVDQGPTVSLMQPTQWTLIARDAFNGVVLWHRPIGPWEGVLRRFRSGPTELSRRLVAVSDRVYVTLGYGKPVTALDAATGEVVRAYAGTEGTVEILHEAGVLYLVAGTIDAAAYTEAQRKHQASPPPRHKRILAVNAGSGKIVWQKAGADTYELMPTTLCANEDRVFFQSISHVVCLDKESGNVLWHARRPASLNRFAWSAPTLVVHKDVVLSADCVVPEQDREQPEPDMHVKWKVTAKTRTQEKYTGELIAFSAVNGEQLWRCEAGQGYNAPADVFVVNDLVWAGTEPGRNTVDFTEGRDLRTGRIERRIDTSAAFTATHHHRCYRDKATDRYILLGRTGVEFIDLTGEKPQRHCWIRGACQYGVLPANGLLYLPPHACACYIQSKLSGLWALAPARKSEAGSHRSERLQKGPAYKEIRATKYERRAADDWPTFRHDAGRTSRVNFAVPLSLEPLWNADLGGRLTSTVVAADVVLVASIDAHIIYALDANTGEHLWRFTVGGRVDSPPTIYGGRVLFGSADGFVYCLRLSDGALVWRFRAAPQDRRTVAVGQIESVWPVTGSVLVNDGVVYCTAGRSSYLDGGMFLCRLDPDTGDVLGERRFYSRDPETGEQPEAVIEDVEMPGALPDVLLYDGRYLYLRDKRMDLKGNEKPPTVAHLYSSVGLLDDNWWHRTYWIWGKRTWGRASGWAVAGRYRPSGRILVVDDETVFGYGRKNVGGNSLAGYHLFQADKQVRVVNKKIKNNNEAVEKYQTPDKVIYRWTRGVPLVGRAMVLAQNALFVAGPVMEPGAKEPGFDDVDSPAALMAFSVEDGEELLRHTLDTQPVFDGMAAANGRLYISTVDGTVFCLGAN